MSERHSGQVVFRKAFCVMNMAGGDVIAYIPATPQLDATGFHLPDCPSFFLRLGQRQRDQTMPAQPRSPPRWRALNWMTDQDQT